MDNVLVKFEAENNLQPGIDGLVQLEVIDKQVAEQVKKTAAVIRERDKDIVTGAKNSKGSIDQLSKSFASLDKTVIGGTMKQTLGDIRNQLKLTDAEAKKFFQNIKENARLDILNGGTPEQLEQLNNLIETSNEMLGNLGEGFDNTGTKTQSFRTRLRELKSELQAMEDAGLEGTAAFEKLQIEAGKVSDQIADTNQRIAALGSDTFVFDAMASGVQGVAGAFSVAQGAAALFGDENKEVAQALLKVQAAMGLLQGVQAVVNVLQKQSAASIAIDILLRRNQATATTAVAVAEGEQAVATEAATAATWQLNAAMLANPAVILLVAIAAITTALVAFTRENSAARDAQTNLNDALAEGNQLLNASLNGIDNANKKIIAGLRERGATDEEIARQEFNNLDQKRKETLAALAVTQKAIDNENLQRKLSSEDYKKLLDQQYNLQIQATDLETQQIEKGADHRRKTYLDDIKSYAAYQDAKVFQARRGSIAELQAMIEAEKARRNAALSSDPNLQPGEIARIKAESNRKVLELDNQITGLQLANKKYLIDASMAETVKGSIDELRLKKESIAAQSAIELNELGISEAKKKLIKAQTAREQREIDDAINIRAIELSEASTQEKLAKSKEGSKEEFNLKLNQLENQKNIELIKAGETEALKLKVQAEYDRKRLELTKQYNQKVAEDTINTRISGLNSEISKLQIANASATNDELLQAKKSLVDEQAQLEVVSVQNSVMSEELRTAKIKAIYDRALADKEQLERDKTAAEIKYNLDMQNGELNIRLATLNRIAAGQKDSIAGSLIAQLEAFTIRTKILANEEKAIEEAHSKGIISEEEYQRKILELKEKYAQMGSDRTNAIIDAGAQFAQGIGNMVFDGQRQRLADEAKADEDLKNKKLITEDGYQRRVKEMNIKKAKADKEQALFNIAINTAVGVAKAIAESPLTFGLPFSAFALAQGVIQGAFVATRKLPQYRHGKVGIQGPGTETSDDIVARISVNESVINAAMTRKWRPVLEAINENRFEDYLGNLAMPAMPDYASMPPVPEWVTFSQPAAAAIDYDRLGESFAKHVGRLSDLPGHTIHIDENGIHLMVQKGNERTEFLNQRYSSN